MERLGPVVLRAVVDESRSQTRNRVLAEERLVGRLAAALVVEAPRRATRPTRGSKERRLQAKGRRSQLKADRRRPRPDAVEHGAARQTVQRVRRNADRCRDLERGLRYGQASEAAEAAFELDELGYRALWLPDAGGGLFEACDVLLRATTRAIVATGILNLWFHEAAETAERYHAFTATYGERFLVGIGVSHQALVEGLGAGEYVKPYSRMVAYLDELDGLAEPLPVGSRLLAALGPKMIAPGR